MGEGWNSIRYPIGIVNYFLYLITDELYGVIQGNKLPFCTNSIIIEVSEKDPIKYIGKVKVPELLSLPLEDV